MIDKNQMSLSERNLKLVQKELDKEISSYEEPKLKVLKPTNSMENVYKLKAIYA